MAFCSERQAAFAAVLLGAVLLPGAAPAAQTTISISTTPPPASPRIQAPLVIAAFPATPLVFAVAATGQAPLSYSATGLPSRLSLASDTGIISGTMPAAGSYAVNVTVTNGAGSASATLTLVSGNTLCPTPPVGWNSYDSFGASIKESEVLDQAKALRSQLQPFGWNYVVIDYRWYEPELLIDSNGRYLPSPSKYPSATGSNGFKSLADKVHALGLGFGIHIMRGIPRKSYDANTPIANSTYKAKDAGNTSDPCPWDQHMWGVRGDTTAGQDWYNSILAQYAQWGVDFIKVDDMINNDTVTYHQAEVDALAKAIHGSGRSVVLSLSPGPMPTANAADLNVNANIWRMVNDFWDYNGLSTLADVFTAAGNWQGVTSLTAGHWPDGDMLPLGYLGPRNEWHASGQTTFTKNEQVTIMSLWSIIPSPLILGGNVASLSSDSWTLALLTNEEVMAVNQDTSGTHGKRIAQQGSTEVWTRDLSGGRKAVALFNRGSQDATVSATFAQLGVTGTPVIRDVWNRADVTGMATGLSVTVPYSGALMYTLSPSGAGTGGATGTGGTLATGGTASGGRASGGTTTGGTASGGKTSGGTASGGTATGGIATGGKATGGTSLSTGGGQTGGASVTLSGGSSTGGTATSGGTTAIGGTAPVAGTGGSAGSPEGQGCNCRTAPAEDGGHVIRLGLFGLCLLAMRRRRARKSFATCRHSSPNRAQPISTEIAEEAASQVRFPAPPPDFPPVVSDTC
jgi:alpha-galactosidase